MFGPVPDRDLDLNVTILGLIDGLPAQFAQNAKKRPARKKKGAKRRS